MNELAQLHCSEVNDKTARLADDEISQYQTRVPDWYISLKDGEKRLEKSFKFKDFKQAMDFTNRVAGLANDQDHHPAILTEWGNVTVMWWTHKIRGLHLNDFIMAAKTEKAYAEYAGQHLQD